MPKLPRLPGFAGAPTLQGQLIRWVLAALLVVWLGLVAASYAAGYHEADELTDGHLASVASLMLAAPPSGQLGVPDVAALAQRKNLRAHDYQQSLSVVVWDAAGRVLARSGHAPQPPFDVADGFQTLRLGADGHAWRSFSRWQAPSHAIKVAVLLNLRERDALAGDIARRVVRPSLALLPLVALVLALAIRRGLRPLRELSRQVGTLDVQHPAPLQAPPHAEFQSMVAAITQLSQRFEAAVAHERDTADAFAHELRTPLASLRLHVDALRSPLSGAERDTALAQVAHDADRAGAVVRDLLALARASRLQLVESEQTVDLTRLARDVVAGFADAAVRSGHELSLEAPEQAPMQGHPMLLAIALRNLLENALAHTPSGSRVTVGVSPSPPALSVTDDGQRVAQAGPGQPARDAGHNGVGAGLGLGHRVVQRVAQVHGAHFEADAPAPGLCRYRIVFPQG